MSPVARCIKKGCALLRKKIYGAFACPMYGDTGLFGRIQIVVPALACSTPLQRPVGR